MEKPETHHPPTIQPSSPLRILDDLPLQMRQEVLDVLVAMLLSQHRQGETNDDPRR